MNMTVTRGGGEAPRISHEGWQTLSVDFAAQAIQELEEWGREVKPNPERTPVQARFDRASLQRNYEVLMAEFLLSLVIIEPPRT
jgi:hypothetical protein